jgi:hypothetical protein
MLLALLLTLGMLTLADRSPLHPSAFSLLLVQDIDEVDCRESTAFDSAIDAPGPSRTSTFSLSGSYTCRRPVLDAKVRNPYVDQALRAEDSRAKRVALSLERQLRDRNVAPIAVKVEGLQDFNLTMHLEAMYRNELSAALGTKRVRRMLSENSPVLVIQMRKVDVPELMSTARLKLIDKQGEVTWLDI